MVVSHLTRGRYSDLRVVKRATGVAAAGAPPGGTYATGVNYAALPAGAMSVNKNGTTYYLSGNTWFKPAYGASGVYYTAVPTP